MTPSSLGTGAFSQARKRALERHEKLTPRAKRLKAQGRLGRKEDGSLFDTGESSGVLSGVQGGTPRELLRNVIQRAGETPSFGHLSRDGTNPLSRVTPSGEGGSLFAELGDSIDQLRDTIEDTQEEEGPALSTLSQRTARLRGLLRGMR
jgi:hypothetical protein